MERNSSTRSAGFFRATHPEVFDEAASTAGVRIGCSALNLVNLVWLGIGTAIHRGQSFAFVLTTTLKLLEDQEGFPTTSLGREKQRAKRRGKGKRKGRSKHDPYRHDPTALTEEAFAQCVSGCHRSSGWLSC